MFGIVVFFVCLFLTIGGISVVLFKPDYEERYQRGFRTWV